MFQIMPEQLHGYYNDSDIMAVATENLFKCRYICM